MSRITSVWLLYETTRRPRPGDDDAAIWPSRLRADGPGRLAGDAGFGEVTRDPGSLSRLDVVAMATGTENACHRHHRHRDPIRGALRLQPFAGIFPDHDLDQLAPPGLVDCFGQQLLVPDVVVACFLLVHRTPRPRAHPNAHCRSRVVSAQRNRASYTHV